MTKHHIYAGGIVNYDHMALYVVIGIIFVMIIATLIGYAIYTYKKKKKIKDKMKEYKITFLREKKDITKK